MPNCEELIKSIVRQGAQVKACGVCASERAITWEELINGVEIAGMPALVEWVIESDKVIGF
jgi:sulfur relay (sulfurtransferase) complex TusBCD TusD component (DsrE family)